MRQAQAEVRSTIPRRHIVKMKEFFQFVSGRDFNADGSGSADTAALSGDELLDAYSQAVIGAAEKASPR